jgi:hypothetical protein
MKIKRRTAAVVAAWTTVGVVGAAALTGVAMAADSSSSPSATSSSATTSSASANGATSGSATTAARANRLGGARQLRGLGSRVLHGEFALKTKDGVKTFDTQIGVVTSVTGTSLAVKSSDGYTQTWTLGADTKVRSDKKAGTLADLKVGATVRLLGPAGGSGATALLAVVRPA